jgi:hypothetical protein
MISPSHQRMNLILTFKDLLRNFKISRWIRKIKLRLLTQEVAIAVGVIEGYFYRSVIESMINSF